MREVRKRDARIKLPREAYKNLCTQSMHRDSWRCKRPLCGCRNNLHSHHIVFRSQGGDDSLENLVTVCARCHDLIHNHKVLVEITQDGPVFKEVKVI